MFLLHCVRGRLGSVLSGSYGLLQPGSNACVPSPHGVQGFCKNILDVADNLERALDSVPGDVLEAAKDGGAGVARGDGEGEAEGAVTCELVAKNLSSLHGGVAMSQKVCAPI